jgi:DNA-binding LacI/PurR family transcriptional regulator
LLLGASRFAILLDPDNQYHSQSMAGFQKAAAERGLDILPVVKRSVDDIGPAFQTMAIKSVQGLLVLADPSRPPTGGRSLSSPRKIVFRMFTIDEKVRSKVVCSHMAPISSTLIVVRPLMLRSCCEVRKLPTSQSSKPNDTVW